MDLIHVTQKVDVIVEDPLTRQRHVYFSRIEDKAEDSLTIAAPYRRGFYLTPIPDRDVFARVTSDNCAYQFKSTLVRVEEDPIPMWVLTPPAELQRIQMRAYVRLNIVLDAELEILENLSDGETFATLTRDISAGGIRVLMNKPLNQGMKVKVVMPLPGTTTIEATGEVVREIPPEQTGDKPSAAIQFMEVKEKTRGDIVKFIFKKQVERRKKEIQSSDQRARN